MTIFTDASRWLVTIEPAEHLAKSITQHWESQWKPWEEAQLQWLQACTEAGYSPAAFSSPVIFVQVKTEEWTITLQMVTK